MSAADHSRRCQPSALRNGRKPEEQSITWACQAQAALSHGLSAKETDHGRHSYICCRDTRSPPALEQGEVGTARSHPGRPTFDRSGPCRRQATLVAAQEEKILPRYGMVLSPLSATLLSMARRPSLASASVYQRLRLYWRALPMVPWSESRRLVSGRTPLTEASVREESLLRRRRNVRTVAHLQIRGRR
jgi:hypothetical protein